MLLSRKRLYRIKKTKEQSRRRMKHRNKKKYRRRKKGKSRGKRRPLNLRKRTMKSYRGGFNKKRPSILMAYETTRVNTDRTINFVLITLKRVQGGNTKNRRYADRLKDLVCVGEDVSGDVKRDELIKDIQDNIRKVDISNREYLVSQLLEYRFIKQVPFKDGIEEWIYNFNCKLSIPRQENDSDFYTNPSDLIKYIIAQMNDTTENTGIKVHDDDDNGVNDNESKGGENVPPDVTTMTTSEIITQLKKIGEQCSNDSQCESKYCKPEHPLTEDGICANPIEKSLTPLDQLDQLEKFKNIKMQIFQFLLDQNGINTKEGDNRLLMVMNDIPFINSSIDTHNGEKNMSFVYFNITRINIVMEIMYRLIWLKNDINNPIEISRDFNNTQYEKDGEVLTTQQKLDYLMDWWRLLSKSQIVVSNTSNELYRKDLIHSRDNNMLEERPTMFIDQCIIM